MGESMISRRLSLSDREEEKAAPQSEETERLSIFFFHFALQKKIIPSLSLFFPFFLLLLHHHKNQSREPEHVRLARRHVPHPPVRRRRRASSPCSSSCSAAAASQEAARSSASPASASPASASSPDVQVPHRQLRRAHHRHGEPQADGTDARPQARGVGASQRDPRPELEDGAAGHVGAAPDESPPCLVPLAGADRSRAEHVRLLLLALLTLLPASAEQRAPGGRRTRARSSLWPQRAGDFRGSARDARGGGHRHDDLEAAGPPVPRKARAQAHRLRPGT